MPKFNKRVKFLIVGTVVLLFTLGASKAISHSGPNKLKNEPITNVEIAEDEIVVDKTDEELIDSEDDSIANVDTNEDSQSGSTSSDVEQPDKSKPETDKPNSDSPAKPIGSVKPNESVKPVAPVPVAPAPVAPAPVAPAPVAPAPVAPAPVAPAPVAPKPTEPVVKWDTNTWYTDVAFDTNTGYDGTLDKGKTIIRQQGSIGQDKHVSNIKYVDGKSADETYEVIRVKEPIEHRVTIGTYEKLVIPDGAIGVKSSPQITAMVNAINADRAKVGLNALKVKPELTNGAAIRTVELLTLFEHNRPNGEQFYTVAPAHAFGENIASASSEGLHTHGLFMNSPGHKANILDPDWNYVGISHYQVGTLSTQWVVLFGF